VQYLCAAQNIPTARSFMDSGIRAERGRYRYPARITLADRAHCRDPRNAIIGSDAQIRLPKQWGWFAAYRHYWFDQLRSNLVLSTASENNPAGAPATTNKSTASAHVNLI
jgi:hypothetical protein